MTSCRCLQGYIRKEGESPLFLLVAAVAPALCATATNFPLYHPPEDLSSIFSKKIAQKNSRNFVQFATCKKLGLVVQYACKVEREPSTPATKK